MRKEPTTQQLEIVIDGELCKVWSVKIGSSTWRAYGSFRAKQIDETGGTVSDSLLNWRRIAEYQANE